jgi:ABC-type dipeptide/oligopeptide/nickel transport system permease component
MLPYLARRVAALGVVLLAVSLVVFAMLRLIPGDPAALIAGVDAQPEEVARVRVALGLDRPAAVQYWHFLVRALSGDLGRSLRSHQLVTTDLATRFRASLLLASVSLALALAIGLPAGVAAALWRGSLWDTALTTASVLGASMPTFWLGLILIGFFSVRLGWLPTSGYDGPEYVVLPALTLGAFSLATIARTARSCMLDVLGHDYVRTARAKGLAERVVTSKHALKNALIPLVAVVGLQFGYLLGASAVTETVFTWPGVGLLLVDAIKHRDLPVIQGAVLLVAASFALVNLIVDVLYATLDPRIRLS